MDIATLGLRVDADGAIRSIREFGKEAERTAGVAEQVSRRISESFSHAGHMVAEAFIGYEAVKWARETLDLGARYQTLGVVMNVVGANAGKSAAEMASLQGSLQKTGISMIESRNNLARMAQAHLNLADATKLARVAQDAAVIGNINSSEAFERLIHGIEAAEPMILRSIGINVGFEESYVKAAHAVGKARDELTEHEKTQIRANAVLESGARIAGTYEAAMGTAGKQIKSTERYLEDAQVKVSEAFQPQFTQAVFAYANALKFAGENASSIAGTIKLVVTAAELAAGIYAGKLLASGLAYVGNLVAQRAATIATAQATVAATATEVAATQVRLGAAENKLRANIALGASAQRLAVIEHEVALAQTRVAMTADGAAAAELALARASTIAGAAVGAAGAMAARGWALIGGPIGAAVLAAIGINALLDRWIEKQMESAELTADQQAAYEKALAAAHAHAPPKPEDPAAETERQRKAKELLHEREGELAKQTALNAAFGQSDSVLKALANRYDAMIQKSQDAKEHKGKELDALNAVTDALTAQKIKADELAAVQARRDQIRDVGFAGASAVRQAEQEVQLIGLATDSLTRKQIAFEAINKSAEAEIVLSKALERADAAQAKTAFEVYSKTMQAIRATSDLALAGADVTEGLRMLGEAGATAAEQQRKAIDLAHKIRDEANAPFKNLAENIQREMGNTFAKVFADGAEAFRGIFDIARDLMARLAGEMVSMFAAKRLLPVMMGALGMSSAAAGAAGVGKTNPLDGLGAMIARGAVGGGIAGGLLGFGVGSMTTNRGLGALGGAASGAGAGFLAAGPIGAATGALMGFVGGILGAGSAAKEAARAMEQLQKSFEISRAAFVGSAGGDTQAYDVARIKAEAEALRAQLYEIYAGALNSVFEAIRNQVLPDYLRQLDEINKAEAVKLANLKDQKAATDALNRAGLNLVQGYKLQVAVFNAMAGQSGPRGGSGGPIAVPTGGSRGTPAPLQPVQLTLNGRVLGEVMLQQYGATATGGGSLKTAFGALVTKWQAQ